MLLVSGDVIERVDTSPDFSPDHLQRHVKSFVERHGLVLRHIGVAVPGLVDRGGAVASCDVLPAFSGWEAKLDLAGLAAKVVVVNDVKAAVLEEFHDAPTGCTGGVVLVGTAVGAGFLANGQQICGASGWAGELGYLPVVYDGQATYLDQLAGGAAIARRCASSPAELAARAHAGDPVVLEEIAAGGRAFGLALAAVVNLLNPSRLAVGGGTVELPGYFEQALQSAKMSSIPQLWEVCEISKVRTGQKVVANGAIRAAEA